MIAIKTLLIGGCVTLGTATAGGVTYATVSSSTPTTSAVVKALPSKVAPVTSALPSSVPTRLPVPTQPPARVAKPVVPTSIPSGVPSPAAPDCAKIPGSLSLPAGLTYAGTETTVFTIDGQRVCSTVQTWKGRAGQWIQAQRIKGKASAEQIRQALKLPEMSPVSLSGFNAWESPLGTSGNGYIYWSTGPGQAELVAATPVYTFQLSDLAAKLHRLS